MPPKDPNIVPNHTLLAQNETESDDYLVSDDESDDDSILEDQSHNDEDMSLR